MIPTITLKKLSNSHGFAAVMQADSARQSAPSENIATSSGKKLSLKSVYSSEGIRIDSHSTLKQIVPVPARVELNELTEDISNQLELPMRPIPRSTADWMTGVFIVVLILFASVKLFFGNYLKQLFNSAFNLATASRLFRERSLSVVHAVVRLDFIFYLVFGLFLYQFLFHYEVDLPVHNPFIGYLGIVVAVFIFYSLKKLFYLIQGSLSEGTSDTLEYIYNLKNYNRILGLLLIPICLLIAFAHVPSENLFFYAGLLLVSVFYILRLLRGVKILMRKHFSIFYLILYLCTLEILPLLFICKLVMV